MPRHIAVQQTPLFARTGAPNGRAIASLNTTDARCLVAPTPETQGRHRARSLLLRSGFPDHEDNYGDEAESCEAGAD